MDAVKFLLEEHKKTKARFAEIEAAGPQQRGALWHALQPELKLHEELEDTYLYGPLSKDPAAKGTALADFEEHQDEDVAELEQEIHKLNQLEPASEAWLTQLRTIKDALMDHVEEEETEILPKVPDVWSQDKLDMSGRQMEAAKLETMRAGQR
jgi:hemerythrin-like domain-containing protein